MSDDLAALEHRIKLSTGLLDEDAYCLTVLVGASRVEVLGLFGVDPSAETEALRDVREDPEYVPVLHLLEGQGAAIAVEPNGYFGYLEEFLEPASVGRRAGSFYSGNDGEAFLALAENGVVRLWEEYLEDLGDVDGELVALFDGLPWAETETWEASALAVIERFTGVRIDGPPPADPMMVYRRPE